MGFDQYEDRAMRSAVMARSIELSFEPPPLFPVVERRLAGVALELWRQNGGQAISGFDANNLIINDIAGHACIASAGAPVTAMFGLAAGMTLDGGEGLAAELRAACDLIAIQPEPVPFEASLAGPARACILVRGVALPIGETRVQVVVSWRELLNRSATTRLRREIGQAMRASIPKFSGRDPFSSDIFR